MAENALQTAQSLSASDRAFIAEVDCLGQRVDLYESQLDEPCVHANRPMTLEEHFKSIDLRFASFALQINERFKAIDERLKAIGERSKARHEKNRDPLVREVLRALDHVAFRTENIVLRDTTELCERAAVLEARAA